MTLTKASIIEKMSTENGLVQKQSSEYIDLLLVILKTPVIKRMICN